MKILTKIYKNYYKKLAEQYNKQIDFLCTLGIQNYLYMIMYDINHVKTLKNCI